MKWGNLDKVDEKERLLYWVLLYVLSPYFEDELDHWLKLILKAGGSLGGDPGWEIEQITDFVTGGSFHIWANPEISGIEPAERIYSKEVFLRATRASLEALAGAFPEKATEVVEVIERYHL